MGYRILVVDDSVLVRRMLVRMLGFGGFPVDAVYEAENGRQALECLEDNWIDMVFTDINMPGMDGVELIRRMEERGLLKDVPVVVISSEGSETRIGELRRMGVRGYLRKPFTPEILVETVEEIMGEGIHAL